MIKYEKLQMSLLKLKKINGGILLKKYGMNKSRLSTKMTYRTISMM
jgi:hypothetical protein